MTSTLKLDEQLAAAAPASLPQNGCRQVSGRSSFLVRPMRTQSFIALLVLTFVQLWSAHAHAADNDSVGRAYTLQATEVARRVILAELVKHPERIHRMSMKCTFQLDKQGHPHNVKVVSSTHNRWAEETARRALAAAKFPPLPKSVIQQSGSDLASLDYQLDLDEPR
jgi:TonB family protein